MGYSHHSKLPEVHDKHEGHHTEDFLRKFWAVLILTIPIVLYSDLPEAFFGWIAPVFPGSVYLPIILGSIVFFYGGLVFLKGARGELKARLPGMMTLIALAITTAYAYSVGSVFFGRGDTLFWELSTLIAVMLIGHFVEMKAVQSAKGALRELAKLLPDNAKVIRGDTVVIVSLFELKTGDLVLVKPGGKIPADGLVVEGFSEANEALLTGESKLISKIPGNEVIAGSINGDGSLKIRVAKVGEATFLSGVMRLVAEAEKSKSRLQLLSDRAAFYLTLIAIFSGGVTFTAWVYVGGGPAFALERMVAVLVIACPHALGLAIPLVASISTTLAARNGFFVKRRLALESARGITAVLFDKTGTLTKGEFSVTKSSGDETLSLAAAVEANSEHPIGLAILKEVKKQKLEIKKAENFKRLPGKGAEADVGGRKIFVGHRGGADILVEADGKEIGRISVTDTIRPEAKESVRAIREMGLRVVMITGDSEEVAKEVTEELGIKEYFARVMPGEKSEKVKLLQSRGERVAMVGDGVNDAPALTQADVGIAIGAGTNVAIESAGIILVKNDPRDIPKIIKLSRLTYAKMLQNLFWATAYNLVALPIAAGVLWSKGIILEPAVAAVFMSLSTVIVAVNASLLRGRRLS